ncbi:MAG: hypothetical protein J6X66_04700 [Lachnospiraceae bacterium]|nr:hypothetical protein [Lachnospiraceae bacterium]
MDTIKATLLILKDYNSLSLFFLIFIAALIYLGIAEKDKVKRMLFVALPAALAAVFLFPVSAWLSMHLILDQEIYYRQLWLIPYGAVVCYALIHALQKCKKIWQRALIITGFTGLLLIGNGKLYLNRQYTPAEKPYHLPQDVIDACDIILSADGVVAMDYAPKCAFPASMVEFNRQYTASILTVYGREAIIERWHYDTPFLDLISANAPIDAEEICSMAAADEIECFVIENDKTITGDPADFGYPKLGEAGRYVIYMVNWLQ